MMRVASVIGNVVLTILKAFLWMTMKALGLILVISKLLLLLFGLVMRIFLAFVRAGTP